jgi:hypothetical protein
MQACDWTRTPIVLHRQTQLYPDPSNKCNKNIIYFSRVKHFTAYNWMSEMCYDLVIRPDKPNVKSYFVNFVDVVKPGPVVTIQVCSQYFKVPMIRTTREMDKSAYEQAVLRRTNRLCSFHTTRTA